MPAEERDPATSTHASVLYGLIVAVDGNGVLRVTYVSDDTYGSLPLNKWLGATITSVCGTHVESIAIWRKCIHECMRRWFERKSSAT